MCSSDLFPSHDRQVGRNSIFALDLHIDKNGVATGSYEGLEGTNAIPAILDEANETTYVKMRKFVFGFQGGFDGQSPAIPINIGKDIEPGNTQGLDCTNSNTAGSIAYKQCIGALSNADEFDINLIVTPGIIYSYHPYVTNLVIDMCEHRGDCFYILDIRTSDKTLHSGAVVGTTDTQALSNKTLTSPVINTGVSGRLS